MKTFLQGALCVIILMAYLIGTINGIGYSIYQGEWVTAICVLVLAIMASPTAWNTYQALRDL